MNYEQFVERLKKSQQAVEFVADYYRSLGYVVEVPELVIAPHSVGAFSKYADNGDLVVMHRSMECFTVEVKHSGRNFENWQYPEMIVNSYTGWHSKDPKPLIHFIVAQNYEKAAWIESSTFDQWQLRSVYDRYKGKELLFYFAPIKLFNFITFKNQNKMAKQNHVINLKIDVSKIDKAKLYSGKKGTYLSATVLLKDEPDQYGNDGFIVQSTTKEERENGVKGVILGNAKYHNFAEAEQGNDLPF